MRPAQKLAGAKCTAETAELRKAQADRPERKQRRGADAGKGRGENCGKTAERLRNLSLPSVSTPITGVVTLPAPSLVKLQTPVNRREEVPGAAPATRGDGWPDDAPPSLARGLPAHEQAVIDAALAILSNRVREPGAALCSPGQVREYLRLRLAGNDRECFGVMFLDVQNRVIDFEILFEGTLTQTTVYPREVVKRVLQLNAAAVILAHNHPSGGAEPSRADEDLTAVIRVALRCIDVRVIDHMVIGWPDIASFAERGLLEPRPVPEGDARPASRSRARRASAAAAA